MHDGLRLIKTGDGSHTILNTILNEPYHSMFGAISESSHIYIDNGLKFLAFRDMITVFEMGFGTGLNALLSLKFSIENNMSVSYVAIENHPLPLEMVKALNYPELTGISSETFLMLHCNKGRKENITSCFSFCLITGDIAHYPYPDNTLSLIYYDAFDPEKQKELWTEDVFSKLHRSMRQGGVLTTYSAKGSIKRICKRVGFTVELVPGPPGKREFIRAIK